MDKRYQPSPTHHATAHSQDLGSLLGAASMGLVANTFGIAAAIETTAALQAVAVLFFALRVPNPPTAKDV